MNNTTGTSEVQGGFKPVLYPPGIPFIVGNEGAERFSYYGMRAVLYMYLTALFVMFREEAAVAGAELDAAEAKATEVTHLFFAGVYLSRSIGAVLSDRFWGKYAVILWVSLIYCAGHAVLAVAGRLGSEGNFDAAEIGMYIGLGLIAIGSGGIKPCVSANVGDQFTKENASLVSRVFQIFYFIINFGSFFSTLLTPLLYVYLGPEVAFGVPGILMGIATFLFWLGRNKFTRVAPKPGGGLGLLDTLTTTLLLSPIFALIFGYFILGSHFEPPEDVSWLGLIVPILAHFWWLLALTAVCVVAGFVLFNVRQKMEEDNGFLAVLLYSVRHQRERKNGQGFFGPARAKLGEEAGDGPPAVLRIVIVFSMVSVFWALFDQHASTWLEQAKAMNLTLEVPWALSYMTVGVTLALALYGATWLFLHVSNVVVPRRFNVAFLATMGLALAVAGGFDVFSREKLEVTLEYCAGRGAQPADGHAHHPAAQRRRVGAVIAAQH